MAWGILEHVKERLTGAIILVALIVLLVPELLTGPIRTKSAPVAASTAAPSRADRGAPAEPPLRSYTLTLGAPPPAPEVTTSAAVAAPAPQPDTSAQGPPQSLAPSPAASPAAGSGAGTGERAGPQPADAHADTASEPPARRVPQKSAGAAGLQAAKPPTHSAVREARSSASSTGWVVQLGSFASRRNADRLAHSLAGRGFRMSVSPARAGTRVLWRVRAGPAHDRAGAQRLAARLRALGHRGELLPVR
jgi:cell division septation protein DedD